MTIDLEAYFERIGYRGPRAPTLEALNALTSAHVHAIPFENLDVLLGRGIDLASEAVFDKLVRRRRGGYCFEQNGLFLEVLTALGFDARPLSARVRLSPAPSRPPPRTHSPSSPRSSASRSHPRPVSARQARRGPCELNSAAGGPRGCPRGVRGRAGS